MTSWASATSKARCSLERTRPATPPRVAHVHLLGLEISSVPRPTSRTVTCSPPVSEELKFLGGGWDVAIEPHRVLVLVGLDDSAHLQDAARGRHRRVGR